MPGLPFAHLNLRRNPFGELTPEERVAVAVVDVDVARMAARLVRPRAAVQFLGDRGRGKTTHLFALMALLPGAPYVHFPEEGPLPSVPAAAVVVLDEVQRLPPRERAALFRRGGSFAIGSHEDHARELTLAGIAVETVRLAGLPAERLQAIVDRRIAAVRRGHGAVPRVTPAGIRRLIARFGDDVRAIEHHLYERVQLMREAGDVEP